MDDASITVCRATPADVSALGSLVRENNAEFADTDYSDDVIMRDHLGDTRQVQAVMVEVDGVATGYATIQPYYNSDDAEPAYWLDELYITPARRSAGLGAALMEGLRRIAQEDGRPSIWWGVERENRSAIAFYDRLGAVDYKATIYRLNA